MSEVCCEVYNVCESPPCECRSTHKKNRAIFFTVLQPLRNKRHRSEQILARTHGWLQEQFSRRAIGSSAKSAHRVELAELYSHIGEVPLRVTKQVLTYGLFRCRSDGHLNGKVKKWPDTCSIIPVIFLRSDPVSQIRFEF